ncbi:MAG TPA: hypothetical protein VIT42_02140 [Microlunatus sp.]
MSRPDQLRIDRFPVANAEFWLSMTARWLAEPGNEERFATDLWASSGSSQPVQVIIAEAAARLRTVLSDPDATIVDQPW